MAHWGPPTECLHGCEGAAVLTLRWFLAPVLPMQTLYNCGPAKVPLPGELRAVEVVQRIKVGRQCEVACVIALWHVLWLSCLSKQR